MTIIKSSLISNKDFKTEYAKWLLNYQKYLLYRLCINLQTAEAYKAINYFLEKVDKRISAKFFQGVNADISIETLNEYNKFFKQYINMGFKESKLYTKVHKDLEKPKYAEENNPKIEYSNYHILNRF